MLPHSVLSKTRARWGFKVFCQLLVRTVEQCVAAGLGDGKKVRLDSSLVRAEACKDSSVKASPELVAVLRQAYGQQERKLEPLVSQAVNVTHVSTTDPEATLGKGGGGAASPLSYKHHRVVDDAQGVITAVKTTGDCAGEAATAGVGRAV